MFTVVFIEMWQWPNKWLSDLNTETAKFHPNLHNFGNFGTRICGFWFKSYELKPDKNQIRTLIFEHNFNTQISSRILNFTESLEVDDVVNVSLDFNFGFVANVI